MYREFTVRFFFLILTIPHNPCIFCSCVTYIYIRIIHEEYGLLCNQSSINKKDQRA